MFYQQFSEVIKRHKEIILSDGFNFRVYLKQEEDLVNIQYKGDLFGRIGVFPVRIMENENRIVITF